MSLKNYIENKKYARIIRYNNILHLLKDPKTCQQVEIQMGLNKNTLTTIFNTLWQECYIQPIAGTYKPRLWQAVKFQYQVAAKNTIELHSQADRYVHNVDSEHFQKQYIAQSRMMRAEKKSAKVFAGVSGYDF